MGVRADPGAWIRPTRTRSTRSASVSTCRATRASRSRRSAACTATIHGLWIDPTNPAVLYNANDGGFYRSADAGKSWSYAASAGGIQFYNVTLDDSTPIRAYGSIQDYGSRRGVVDLSQGRDKIPAVAWSNAPGGEGSHHAIQRGNNNIVDRHGFYGNFTRTDVGVTAAWNVYDAAGTGRRRAAAGDARAWQISGRRQKTASPTYARSGWRQSSVHSTIGRRSMSGSSSCSAQRTAARRGASQPGPLQQRPLRDAAEKLERNPLIRPSSRSPSRHRSPACSTQVLTTAGSTSRWMPGRAGLT